MSLELHDVAVTIGRVPILRGISLSVPDGAIIGLLGRNGAGKTTTLRAIMGLVRVRHGAILLGGRELLARKAHARASAGIGYLPEDRRLVPQLSVEENLLVPVWANRLPDGKARLVRVYQRMPLVEQFRHRRAAQLSGGQQKLVALARALVVGSRLLLLDEPFEGLAPALADEMATAIRQARDDSELDVLFVESERRLVDRLAERTFTIERGEILATPVT